MSDDFFSDETDPQAAEREQRRREREERRAKREEKDAGKAAAPAPVAAAPPPEVAAPPPTPPLPPRGASTSRPPGGPRSNRRRLGLVVGLAAVLLGIAAIAALAYKHFHKSTPPPAPVVLKTITVTIPEGYTRPQTAEVAKQEGLRRQLREGQRALQVPQPGQVRGQGRKGPRGLPLSRHLRTEEARQRRRTGAAAARRLQEPHRRGQHELRPLEEPDGLRRGHDRLDDRARGGQRRRPQEGRRG